jgi:hypothetical protein
LGVPYGRAAAGFASLGAALLSALANATLRIPNALRHSNKNIVIFLQQKQFFPDKIVKIKQ